MTIYAKLLEMQRRLRVGKGQHNSFGGFNYRSKEDILNAAKPIAFELGCVIVCNDRTVMYGEWHYIETTAKLIDAETGESVEADGNAREPEQKKGMDAAQVTGTASSYAGKRALGNLFAIDDTPDSDSYDNREQPKPARTDPAKKAKAELWHAIQDIAATYGFDALQAANEFAPAGDAGEAWYKAAASLWDSIADWASQHKGDVMKLMRGVKQRTDCDWDSADWVASVAAEFAGA